MGRPPIAGWFLLGKIPSFEMDDGFGGTPMTQETPKWRIFHGHVKLDSAAFGGTRT